MEERRESPSGMSFYSLYRDCPRSFYLKYVQGIKYRFTGKALLFGSGIHEALESYYQHSCSLSSALQTFHKEIQGRKGEYEKESDYLTDLEEGPQILEVYDGLHGEEDKKRWEILELEKQHTIFFGPDNRFKLTIRCDRVVRDRELKKIFPVESKTTRYSIPAMFKSTLLSDQPLAYIWALQKIHPEWEVNSCLIDILYKRGKVIDCQRPGFAVVGRKELQIWEMEMIGTILEVSQKIASLSTIPHPFLFPCNRKSCSRFGCEYEKICRVNLKPDERPPMFVKDSWKKEMDEEMKRVQDFKLEEVMK